MVSLQISGGEAARRLGEGRTGSLSSTSSSGISRPDRLMGPSSSFAVSEDGDCGTRTSGGVILRLREPIEEEYNGAGVAEDA